MKLNGMANEYDSKLKQHDQQLKDLRDEMKEGTFKSEQIDAVLTRL